MANTYQLKISGVFLLCLSAAAFAVPGAEAAGMAAKLERCRKSAKTAARPALDCFYEVKAKGDREERQIASYYIRLLSGGSAVRVPPLAEAAARVRKNAASKGAGSGVRTIPAAASGRGKPRPSGEDQLADPRPAKPGKMAQRAPLGAASLRRRAAAAGKNKYGKFQVEEAPGTVPARANSGRAARAPGAGLNRTGGSFSVREAASVLKKTGMERPASTDVSSVTLQEMDLTPELEVAGSEAKETGENHAPLVSDTIIRQETSKVALARLNTNAAFTIEDDLLSEPESSDEQTGEVRFAAGAAEIGETQLAAIGRAAGLMRSGADKITVRGLASPEEKNPESLSKARANAVERLLKQKFRVPAGSIAVEWGVGVDQEDQCVLIIVKAGKTPAGPE